MSELRCICDGPSTYPCGPTCHYPYTDESRLRTPQYTEAYVVGLERQLAKAKGKLEAVKRRMDRAWAEELEHKQENWELRHLYTDISDILSKEGE